MASEFMSRAREDFIKATRSARLRRIWSSLTGQNDSLIPFEELKQTVGLANQYYRGVQVVPVDKIIGSLGRSGDFDRVFMPLQKHSRVKWLSVDSAYLAGVSLPPISLYKIGDAYFVVDGHHRLSVARQQGQKFIDAEVVEVKSRVPVTADLTVDDLDDLAAYRDFLEQTKLDILRPGQTVRLTMPGDYAKLIEHIRVHKYFVDRKESRELSWDEAVAHWYDHVYWPVVSAIRRHKLLKDFPGHTEADLYLWIIEHAYYLSQKMGRELAPGQVATDFARRFGQSPQRWIERTVRFVRGLFIPAQLEAGPPAGAWREERLVAQEAEHIFRDVLVTVTGAETGWRALAQAAEFAHYEHSVLHGLHVAPSNDEKALAYGRQVLDEFTSRCKELGVQSTSSLAVGDIAQQIVDRARWVDMVVINQRREQGRWAERPLGTIFQTVTSLAARPILAVPGEQVRPIQNVVLAYDGGPKSREALFVLRHLLTCWHVRGVIMTVANDNASREILDEAWTYIEQCGCTSVATHYEQGPVKEAILRVMEQERADLLLMGSYSYQPILKAFLGSTVDQVLREAWFPVLICR